MKIGILGGTFSPIHKAHIELGRQAMSHFGLDQILVMPTGNSYFKSLSGHVLDAYYREMMVRLAIEDEEKFACSDMEIQRKGYTYTSDTLLQLSRENPEAEWYFIIGADSLHTMRYWYAPEIILRHAAIIVADRHAQVDEKTMDEDRKYLEDRYHGRILTMDFDGMDISSTELRQEIRISGPDPSKIPEKVCRYIEKHYLYQDPLTMEEIDADLKKRLKPSRYQHTLGVVDTAKKLAVTYGADPDRAALAALVHDCGKYEGSALTHGPIGARIARNEYGISDPEILSAVSCHTTGKPHMTLLEKIIFVADYIEPGRDQAPGLAILRVQAYEDLDGAIVRILRDTMDYLIATGTPVDGSSIQTYDYYMNRSKRPHD